MSSLVCSCFLFMFVLFGSFGQFVRTCALSWRCCVTTTNVSLLQHAWCMLRGVRAPPPPPGQECTRAGVSLTPTGPIGPTNWLLDGHAAWVSSWVRDGAAPFASVFLSTAAWWCDSMRAKAGLTLRHRRSPLTGSVTSGYFLPVLERKRNCFIRPTEH